MAWKTGCEPNCSAQHTRHTTLQKVDIGAGRSSVFRLSTLHRGRTGVNDSVTGVNQRSGSFHATKLLKNWSESCLRSLSIEEIGDMTR